MLDIVCRSMVTVCMLMFVFVFQAEDGIRDLVRSRGLGDVYKRQGGLWSFMRPLEGTHRA